MITKKTNKVNYIFLLTASLTHSVLNIWKFGDFYVDTQVSVDFLTPLKFPMQSVMLMSQEVNRTQRK